MDTRNRRNYVPYYVTDLVRRKEIYDDTGRLINGDELEEEAEWIRRRVAGVPRHVRRLGKLSLPSIGGGQDSRGMISQSIGKCSCLYKFIILSICIKGNNFGQKHSVFVVSKGFQFMRFKNK